MHNDQLGSSKKIILNAGNGQKTLTISLENDTTADIITTLKVNDKAETSLLIKTSSKVIITIHGLKDPATQVDIKFAQR